MPRPFQEDEKKRIRERLLLAGRELVNRLGLKKVSIDDAVKAAGISKGSFYTFFSSREDYLLSILESWEDCFRPQMLARLEEKDLPPVARWKRFLMEMLRLLETQPGLASIGPEDIRHLESRLPPGRMEAHQAADRQVWEEAVKRFIALGILSPEAAPALQGIIQTIFILGLHRNDFENSDFEAAAEIISGALARELAGG